MTMSLGMDANVKKLRIYLIETGPFNTLEIISVYFTRC